MDFYPSEFSPEARDRIEKEKIRACREILPNRVYGFNEQHLAIRCIMRIFRAFAEEACALRKERGWTIERIESESKEFLRRLTIMVVFDKFPGLDQHWISNLNGSINSDVERRLRDSAEWKEYEDLLIATPASTKEESRATSDLLHEKQISTLQPADQNLRDAILKKKARIVEIERVLNRPPLTEHRGQPVHGGQNWRLRIEEERQHLTVAVEELEAELASAFADRAIASRKRRESLIMPGIADQADTPLLDAQKSRFLLGIELSDLENLRREVWIKFFDEATLPRVVETEWEPVLSSRKMPDSHVDLGLTLALTKEYAKAISRASAQLADLLVTAALSRISQEHFREAIWRECLDFAYQLGQWDVFVIWADRAVHVRWQAVDADGEPSLALDRESEKRLEERREFFRGRIGTYSREWLSAIDRAIELRRTLSATQTIAAAEEKRKGMSSEATVSSSVEVPQKGKSRASIPSNWTDLLNRKSISQKEAAEFLECDPRTVRRRITERELTRSPKGRVVCNERLRKQIRDVHGEHVLR